MAKICRTCDLDKPLEEFNKKNQNKDGLDTECKPCARVRNRAYQSKYKGRYSERINTRRARVVEEKQLYVLDYLSTHPCVDCGETDPVVLQFDHQRDKIRNISSIIADNCNLEVLVLEIEKCLVRCANCHIRKTAKDFGFWKVALHG